MPTFKLKMHGNYRRNANHLCQFRFLFSRSAFLSVQELFK